MTVSRHRLSGGRHLGTGRLVRLVQDEPLHIQSGAGEDGPGDPCIDNPSLPECCIDAATLLDGILETDANNIYNVDHISGASAGGGQAIFTNTVFGIGSIDATVPSSVTIFSENNKNLSNAATDTFSPSFSILSRLGYARYRKGLKVNDPFPTGTYAEIKKVIKSVPRASLYHGNFDTLSTGLNEGGIDYTSDNEIIPQNVNPITRDRGLDDPRLQQVLNRNAGPNTAAAGPGVCVGGCGTPGSAQCQEFCENGSSPDCSACPQTGEQCECEDPKPECDPPCEECFTCFNGTCQQSEFGCNCPGGGCLPCTKCVGGECVPIDPEDDCDNPDNADCPACDPCSSCNPGEICCDDACTTPCSDGSCPPCDECPDTSTATVIGDKATEIRGNFARRDLHAVAFFRHDLNQGDTTYSVVGNDDTIISCILELTVSDVYGRLDHTASTPRVTDTKYNVHKIINSNFNPNAANYKYANAKLNQAWNTPFARGLADRSVTESSSFTVSDNIGPRQKITIDLTALAQDAAKNNNGVMDFLIESVGEFTAPTGNTLTTNRKDRPSQFLQFYTSGKFRPRVILNVYRGRRGITQMKLPWQR